MQVSRWGNSLAIRIPAAVAKALDLKEGDEVEVTATQDGRLEVARDCKRSRAIERIKSMQFELPPGWKFDREEANKR